MKNLSRRHAIQSGFGLAALGISTTVLGNGPKLNPFEDVDLAGWIASVHRNAKRLADHKQTPLFWQEAMDEVYSQTPMAALKQHLEFRTLSKRLIEKVPADRPELFHRIQLASPDKQFESGKPEPRNSLVTKIAYVKKGRSIPPHGHSNMVSAFLCLSGEFEVRQYDRLFEEEEAMVVRQSTHQRRAGAGTWSSISDYRDNVHWLTAKTDDCFILSCKMINVEQGKTLKGRINLDLKRAKKIGSTTFHAPKITSAEARELY